MLDASLECLGCGESAPVSVRTLRCPRCGSLYGVRYGGLSDGRVPRLPLRRPGDRISLGEGGTPVVNLARTAAALGLLRLWAKLELQAPTGSFKDRGSSITVSAAAAEGVGEVVEDSSGNAGASLAAYCAAAGIRAHVFAPADAAAGKLHQIAVFGAELHRIPGPRQAATDAALEFVQAGNHVYLSHNYSPLFPEGLKGVAYELAASDARGAQHVVIPAGNGSLVLGLRRGFEELAAAGVVDETPALHAAQSEAVRPLESAINGASWSYDPTVSTVAGGIASPFPPRLAEVVEAVRATGGGAVAVPDDETLAWQRRLARDEGLYCEATSAVAFAGLSRLMERGVIPAGAEVTLPVTGSGLKEPAPAR